MEQTLTKKQAEALRMACRHWNDDIRLITDEDSFERYSDWKGQLKHISYAYTLPVDISEMYKAMNELCIALTDILDKGELS